MALLRDLLEDIEGDIDKIERQIKRNAKAVGVKILLDDGDEDCYVPKSRLDKKIKELKDLEEKIGEGDATEALEKLKKEKETLECKVADFEKKIKYNALTNHMSTLAKEFNCQDPSGLDLLNFIDQSKIVYKEDGTVEGVKEQVEALKENKAYLFGNAQPNNQQPNLSIANILSGGTGVPGNMGANAQMNGSAKQEGVFGQQLFDMSVGNNDKKIDSDYYFNN